ncbi:unnamed protein product [Allacma fusca]|uniref:Uncharacterized protein n=1 Tax=Allacma fusca TaxID=39272 RepID=A0A8J2KAS4_9HEXA|nr:unnamed protein product [Allacma fusca]
MTHFFGKKFQQKQKRSSSRFQRTLSITNISLSSFCSTNEHKGFELPGKGSGKGSACCCKGLGGDDVALPQVSFDQDESNLFYKIEFASEMHHSWWSVGLNEKQFLIIKAVVHPPYVWFGHVRLKEPLVDECITTEFENECRKIIITMTKSDDTRWRLIGAPQPEDNRIMPSTEVPLDFYPATIIHKEKLISGHYLIAIRTGCEYQFSVPVAWHMMIRIGDVYKPYSPIKFITAQQEAYYKILDNTKKRSSSTVTYFIIRIHPGGEITPKLLVKSGADSPTDLELGSVLGRFDTDWLYQTDRLLIFAGGSGIAPWTSLIKFIKDRPTFQVKQVVLILSCRVRNLEDMIWHPVWVTLSLLDWFFYVPYATLTSDGEEPRRFTLESIIEDLAQIPNPSGTGKNLKQRGVASGPEGFTDSCHSALKKLNFDEEDILLFRG